MKFLLDQDVYAITARFLRESGHDVIWASDLGLSRAADEMLLQEAEKQNLILITRDRDYGNLLASEDAQAQVKLDFSVWELLIL